MDQVLGALPPQGPSCVPAYLEGPEPGVLYAIYGLQLREGAWLPCTGPSPHLWTHNCCFPSWERMTKANSSYSAATGYEPNRECLTPRRGESC